MFIPKIKLDSFKNPKIITKDLVAELISVLKTVDTGNYVINKIVLNYLRLSRAYLFMAFLYNLDYRVIIDKVELLSNDEFTKYLLEYTSKIDELKRQGNNELTRKLSFIAEQVFKKRVKYFVERIFVKYQIEKDKVSREYRQKFLSKEY